MHFVYAVVVDQGQLYTDLTRKFPVRSSKDNWYVMICFAYDCKYSNAVPTKSRSASEWLKAYEHIHRELTSRVFKPKLQTLDNEASATLKSFEGASNNNEKVKYFVEYAAAQQCKENHLLVEIEKNDDACLFCYRLLSGFF
jgi:hypothetical protein